MSAEVVVFQLYGPLVSWGDVAVGEVRPSWPHPSRSAILGLVAACLGIRHGQEQELQALAAEFAIGLEVWSIGLSLDDYHTVQAPPGEGVRLTRRAELAGPGEALSTVLSRREYRCDAFCRVALWPRHEGVRPAAEVAQALLRPAFSPYLGRKACPLGLPMHPRVVAAADLVSAFRVAPAPDGLPMPRGAVRLFWEDDIPGGLAAQQRQRRYDDPVSHARRQFGARWENQAALPGPEA